LAEWIKTVPTVG